jgi:hypothetical protein
MCWEIGTAAGAPYQCTKGHTIPHRLSEKVDAEVAKEIDEGHLEEVEVEYHPNMWISPLFRSYGAV